MASTNCLAKVAASIVADCASNIQPGYTGRAILINMADAPTIAVSDTNPRIISSISVGTNVKTVAIDNVFIDPFSGSSKTGNVESGQMRYDKKIVVQIPLRGAATSRDIIEPLFRSAEGFLLILEKKDNGASGLGKYEIYGTQCPVKGDGSSYTRDESANGGAASVTLTTTEYFEEVNLFDTDLATTKAAFETLLGKAY